MEESKKLNKTQEKIKEITEDYKIEIIKDVQTPKITKKIKSAKSFVKSNQDLLSSIALFLSDPLRRNAVGLAANQVSCNGERLMENFFMIRQNLTANSGFDIIINPEIIEKRGTPVIKYEECLTWTNKSVKVTRYPFLVVNYHDIEGVRHEGMTVTGFEAQIWQHEVDHLTGVKEELIQTKSKPKTHNHNIGRNEPCPCGSGKKYKKCCLLYDTNW